MLFREGKPGTQFMSVREQFQKCRSRCFCSLTLFTEAGDSRQPGPTTLTNKKNLHLETGLYRGENPQGEASATCCSLQRDDWQLQLLTKE
jgi:hypothetical protein